MHGYRHASWFSGPRRVLGAMFLLGLVAGCGTPVPSGPPTDRDIVNDRIWHMRLDKDAKSIYGSWVTPDRQDRAQINILFRSAGRYFSEGQYLQAVELYEHVIRAYFTENGGPRWPLDRDYATSKYFAGWAFSDLCKQDPEYCGALVRLMGAKNEQAAIDADVLSHYQSALSAALPTEYVRHAVQSCVQAQKNLAASMKMPPKITDRRTLDGYQALLKAKCE